MIAQHILDSLEWNSLIKILSQKAQTFPGKEHLNKLEPTLNKEEIERSWEQQLPIRDLVKSGYIPPIGDLPELRMVFRGASLGQILEGQNFRDIFNLLETTRAIARFLGDFEERCKPLTHFANSIYPLPKLQEEIQQAIAPDGSLLDTASDELLKIRHQKVSQRKKIETEIRQLLVDQNLESYLQDKFFTMRSDRYVVPMRLDGRGRIKGSIYDTSDSGQTLYLEPQQITPLNDALLELEISEKLEIIKIYRTLSASVASELDIITTNYEKLIDLDILTAKAELAADLDAGSVTIAPSPTLDLYQARHPLLGTPEKNPPTANDILLEGPDQLGLIVSGPNAGGKTVVLKTVGILHLMMKSGLLIPASDKSSMYVFDNIFLAMGDPQSIEASLSTFSGHLLSLKPILEKSNKGSLVLLDELAVGTDPQTGSSIAQAILEELVEKMATVVCTTHFDALKTMAVSNSRFRNGSMEFSTGSLKPTYNLVLDLPGQSYGLEVAEQLGLSENIIHRAKELRGQTTSELDRLIRSLSEAKEKTNLAQKQYEQKTLETETIKHHWESERESLRETKQKAAKKVQNRFEEKISHLKRDMEDNLKQLKDTIRALEKGQISTEAARHSLQEIRKGSKEEYGRADQTLNELLNQSSTRKEIPGKPCKIEDLKVGDPVFVISIGKEAKISKITEGKAPIEVQAGLLKLRPPIQEIRLLSNTPAPPPKKKNIPSVKGVRVNTVKSSIGYTPSTKSNTLDLRGQDQDSAIQKLWLFLDKAIMGGRSHLVIIHGHGTDTLKKSVRTALAKDSPYAIDFRPGSKEEGGDGVTIIRVTDS